MLNRTSLLLVPLLMLACQHEKKQVSHPAVQPGEAPPAQATSGGGAGGVAGKSCRQDLECGPRQLCIRSQCVDITADLAECSMVRVQFDFNSSELHPDARSQLDRMARCLKADRALHVTIEGNADERGTQEYNLALGDRRATVVAKYLELLGVSEAQLKTVSYGKEQPLCSEHDEACWSKNRRAALKPKENRR